MPASLPAMFLAAVLLAGATCVWSQAPSLAQGNQLLQCGHADDAERTLQALLATHPPNAAAAQLLLCRVYVSAEAIEKAVDTCSAAAAAAPNSSVAADWMGRALGLAANQSGPIAGLRLAPRVRIAFERAVQLDPHNAAAINDLGEFYIAAPSVIGGGLDKARALAERSEASNPQAAHRLLGLAAQKGGDNALAEAEFRRAIAVANRPEAWVDLGHFYATTHQPDNAVDALQHAVALDRSHGSTLVDAAEILINDAKVRPDLAEQWLRLYLNSGSQTDAAPAFRALTDLARLAKKRGDTATQHAAAEHALTLASKYPPALKLAP